LTKLTDKLNKAEIVRGPSALTTRHPSETQETCPKQLMNTQIRMWVSDILNFMNAKFPSSDSDAKFSQWISSQSRRNHAGC